MTKVYNFSAGPAILPHEVLAEAQAELLDYKGSGMSIMEVSHRGKEYSAIHEEATHNLKSLLGVPDDYAVLFLQGGASHQFAMVPMNFLGDGQTADYTDSGSWGKKATEEAQKVGKVNVAANTNKDRPCRVPTAAELNTTPNAAYLHITSNETISGAQWRSFPQSSAPLIVDMSSDILSRTVDVSQFALIYAGAQKNLGPSGVTIVVVKKDFAESGGKHLPGILRYQTHLENDSLYNTPPTFAVYLVCLVTRWVLKQGGVPAMQKLNHAKAAKLYAAIDATGFFRGAAAKEFRSTMNVTFNLPSEDLEKKFDQEATKQGLSGLKGHRSVGGIRASIYNAFPLAGVDALVSFMKEFERVHA